MMPRDYRQRDVTNPHFMVPFQFGGVKGGAFMNEQDSSDDVMDCIRVIVAFPLDSLVSQPGFGIPDVVFEEVQAGHVPEEIKSALMEQEERLDYDLEGGPSQSDELIMNLLLKVRTRNA